MPHSATPYEDDFVRWTEEQAGALRRAARSGTNLPLDFENLAEEVESLGKSDRRELASRIATVIEHLIKLEHSPARDPSGGWRATVRGERVDIERLLEDSPSLRNELAGIIRRETARTTARVAAELLERGEIDQLASARLQNSEYGEDQVLGDWLPGGRAGAGAT